jgi:hypothetical protein
MFGKRALRDKESAIPKSADRILAEIDGEPRIFSIRGRAAASYPSVGKSSIRWPLYRLEEASGAGRWVLEETGESFLLYRKSADGLAGLSADGKALDLDALARIQAEAAAGRAASIETGGASYLYRLSSRLSVSDEDERYRFIFEDAPRLLIVEAYAARPSDFAVFEGRVLASISSAWREGRGGT